MHGKNRWALVGLLLLLFGCAVEKERAAAPPLAQEEAANLLQLLSVSECRSVLNDDAGPDSLRQAAERNAEYLTRQPFDARVRIGTREVSIGDLSEVTRLLKEQAEEPSGLCERLDLYRLETGVPVRASGFYQPELRASRTRSARFRLPLYRTPDDLVEVDLRAWCPSCPPRILQGRVREGKLVPYYTRSEIEAGALAGRGYEIAWLDDPVEAYFLHVQGSALLELEDGVRLQVSYAGTNGHPYVSLGKILTERGKLARSALSLQELKDYLRAHPEEQAELFAANPQYVFFRGVVAGPLGSCQVPLTAGRSLAADPAFYPHGGAAFLVLEPEEEGAARKSYHRLVFFQDSGTTVSGPQHLALYCGSGPLAEAVASRIRHRATVYLLLPRSLRTSLSTSSSQRSS